MKKEIRDQAKKMAAKFGTTHEQREDIELRCLEEAWKAETKVKEDGNAMAYLSRIMYNAAIDYVNENSKNKDLSLDLIVHQTENPEDKLIDKIMFDEKLPNFLSKLKSPDREIISLLMEGYTLVEIGKKLNTTSNALAVRIHRRKKLWKKYLGYEKEETGAPDTRTGS